MPFPDLGNYAALGYSQASGVPLEMGMIRNHYIGRTFIQPTQSMRDFSVRVKLNPVRSCLEGKRVIVMEDSIIRGTTGRSRVQSLQERRGQGGSHADQLPSTPLPLLLRDRFLSPKANSSPPSRKSARSVTSWAWITWAT